MNDQNLLPDSQTAFNNLFAGVHQEVFFRKLAAAGHVPQTAEEAQAMLDTAGKLRDMQQSAPVKQATDANNPYHQANRALGTVMEQYGFTAPRRYQEEEMAIKSAAAQLSQDPVLYNSILALKLDEANAIKQQYAAQR